MRGRLVVSVLLGAIVACGGADVTRSTAQDRPRRNVIIVVMDGLRAEAVNPTDAPAMTALRTRGVHFANSHAVLPSLTTPNAAAIATGHYPGDTGDFSNFLFPGYPIFDGRPPSFAVRSSGSFCAWVWRARPIS